MEEIQADNSWRWIIVLASAFIKLIIFGISHSSGVVYVVILEMFHEGTTLTSWISSLMPAVLFMICPLSGYLAQRFDERKVAIIGGIITAVGMISSAYVNSVPALITTYGVISGLGCGIGLMPGVVAVAKHFSKDRTLALGIASAGSGVGMIALPPIIEVLSEKYSWRGMLLILGGVSLNIIVFGALFRPSQTEHDNKDTFGSNRDRPEHLTFDNINPLEIMHKENDRKTDVKISFFSNHSYLKMPAYYLILLNIVLYQFGSSILFGHLQAYAVYELDFSQREASYLYTTIGIVVLIFKVIQSILANAQKYRLFSPIYQYIFFIILGGIATLCLLIKTKNAVYICSAVFGMSYAATGGSLITTILIDVGGVEELGMMYGIHQFWLAIGHMFGAPLAGYLYEQHQSYNSSFVVAGILITVSAVIMMVPCIFGMYRKRRHEKEHNHVITKYNANIIKSTHL